MLRRRALLGTGGAMLALPWLEALAPRPARGQSLEGPRRFLPVFFGCGAPEFWWPATEGVGSGWQLTSILAPFAPFKERVLLLGNVENYSPFNADGSSSVEPSHGRLPGAFLTGVDAKRARDLYAVVDANGISADQVLAQAIAGQTRLESLQLGLTTIESYCDGQPCSSSRSISWASPTKPLYKLIDPQAVFDLMFGPDPAPENAGTRRDRSVIDAVLSSSKALGPKLSASDRQILDRYLTSLRNVEQRVASRCAVMPTRPTFKASIGMVNGQNGYDRSAHFDVMNDLIALAFQCDLTRVISFMLDDERSNFLYDHVELRQFTATSVSPPDGTRVMGDLHGGGQSGDNNVWCSIMLWQSLKLADLCRKLAELPEGDGSVLDGVVMLYGSSMHGANHNAANLPSMLVGSPKVLSTDRYYKFPLPCAQRDLLYTLLNGVFGLNVTTFGESAMLVPNRLMTEVLA